MSIRCEYFGRTEKGEDVLAFRLENARGAYARILNYGGVIQSVCVPGRDGRLVDVVLGYGTAKEYEGSNGYLGALVGRVANRIGQAGFDLNGKHYPLPVREGSQICLHGGKRGFSFRIWEHRIENDALILSLRSPDGEEGFPGNLDVQVTYTFSEDGRLKLAYCAQGDADTIVSLTNHVYFNLDGEGDVRGQLLQMKADAFTEVDETFIPTGRNLPVADTPMDFREAKPIGRDIDADFRQMQLVGGYDHNYVLSQGENCVRAVSEKTGVTLTLSTDLPGLQLYTANMLTERVGKAGKPMGKNSGFCLETQFFPDTPHRPEFPSIVLRAGEVWAHCTEFAFGTEA